MPAVDWLAIGVISVVFFVFLGVVPAEEAGGVGLVVGLCDYYHVISPGPWTPRTRICSMSAVRLGPVISTMELVCAAGWAGW